MNKEDIIKFEDAESYTTNSNNRTISFKDIVLNHVKKIGTFASVELRGGYWEERIDKSTGETFRFYVQDTREIYSNAVEYLHDILYPYFDKDMEEKSEKINEKLKKLYKKRTVKDDNPDEDNRDELAEGSEGSGKFKNVEERITYRSIRVRICRRLFRHLCCFLFRKKYLEMTSIED